MNDSLMIKERIDKLLLQRGLAESPTAAQALVMAGVVLANEHRLEKPSDMVMSNAVIRLKGDNSASKYVGRGGLKLEHALDEFHIRPSGYVCIDIGSSTGGFSDCLLKYGAAHVTAIDAGTNQLVWSLRKDDRVDVRENTNARGLRPGDFNTLFDLAVIDVSFISVTKILGAIIPLLSNNGRIITLIKPQFEVERGEVGKGGIVRESEKHERVVAEINLFARSIGLSIDGIIESPILGAAGNKEFFALYGKNEERGEVAEAQPFVEGVDFYFEGGMMVLTSHYLSNRGYCCGNGCRNCPFGDSTDSDLE